MAVKPPETDLVSAHEDQWSEADAHRKLRIALELILVHT
jgi:hypothetical protein